MIIEWLGHSAFKIISEQGVKILTDPYESGGYSGAVGYSPIKEEFDIVTISHEHPDHSFVKGLAGHPKILKGKTAETLKDVRITSLESFHDTQMGKARGKNWIFIIEASGTKVVHMGDLGHILDETSIQALKPIDILLLPVGGTFTIDATQALALTSKLNPILAIPMHFKTGKLGFDINTIEPYLSIAKDAKTSKSSKIEYIKNKKQESGIVVLTPSH